jgi:hypothetical protein
MGVRPPFLPFGPQKVADVDQDFLNSLRRSSIIDVSYFALPVNQHEKILHPYSTPASCGR